MIKKLSLAVLVLLFFGLILKSKIPAQKKNLIEPKILEQYGTLEKCRLVENEVSELLARSKLANQNCSYEVVDYLADNRGVDIYLLSVNILQGKPWTFEGIIVVDKRSGAKLIDLDSVWGHFHHAKDFDLNTKYTDIKDIAKDTDNDGKVEIIINKETVSHDAIYKDIYRLSDKGFEYLRSE